MYPILSLKLVFKQTDRRAKCTERNKNKASSPAVLVSLGICNPASRPTGIRSTIMEKIVATPDVIYYN